MSEFEIVARIRFTLEADNESRARDIARNILTNLLEPKDIDLMGIVAKAVPASVGISEAVGAKKLLKALEREVFTEAIRLSQPRKRTWRGVSIPEFPLSLVIGDIEAEGTLVEVPPESLRPGYAGDPEAGIPPESGEVFDVPEGHHIYGWSAKATLDVEEIGRVEAVARSMTKKMISSISKVGGKVATSASRAEEDPEEEMPLVAVSQGIFTAPVPPEEVARVLKERIGIRSILPKGT